MPKRKAKPAPAKVDHTIEELLNTSKEVMRTSKALIEQMKELTARIAREREGPRKRG